MSNIWEFLVYTLDLSIFAGLILIIKKVFKGRLSPIWHYSIWSVLAFQSILLLIGNSNYYYSNLFVLNMKIFIEGFLNSSYSSVYSLLDLKKFSFSSPSSITDWFFVVYILGVVIFALKSVLNYVKLKMYIKKHSSIDKANEEIVQKVCLENGFKPCKVLNVEGVSSTFICGFFKPVIIVANGEIADEKVIIHEFMHFKYHDNLKSIFWCFLRCLNWCNPFINYVINTIKNDIEMSRDQKVLEKLEGEERRDYGRILLFMADDKYASILGTTSVSNGGKNIKKRIEMMLLFKKYPRDLNIVTNCILVVILCTTLYQYSFLTASASVELNMSDSEDILCAQNYVSNIPEEAIDFFALGLGSKNLTYLAIASPSDEIETYLTKKFIEDIDYNDISYFIESQPSSDYRLTAANWILSCVQPSDFLGYEIFNFQKTNSGFSGYLLVLYDNAAYFDKYYDNSDFVYSGTLQAGILIPFEVFEENGGWVFDETGDFEVIIFSGNKNIDSDFFDTGDIVYEADIFNELTQTYYYSNVNDNFIEDYLEPVSANYESDYCSASFTNSILINNVYLTNLDQADNFYNYSALSFSGNYINFNQSVNITIDLKEENLDENEQYYFVTIVTMGDYENIDKYEVEKGNEFEFFKSTTTADDLKTNIIVQIQNSSGDVIDEFDVEVA